MGTDTLDRTARAGRMRGRQAGDDRRIDPRIRQRRIGIQRDQGRRRLWKLGVLLGLVAIVAAAVAALRSPLLDVDHIVVAGSVHTPREPVVAASGVGRETPLASVSVETASRRVAALPWVLSANVRRVWPGTVRITVTERRPITQIRATGGGWLLVDRSGRLLDRQPTMQAGLVTLTGSEPAAPGSWLGTSWADGLRIAATLPRDVRSQVASVVHDRNGSGLLLTNGARVILGRDDPLGPKFEALRTLLDQPDQRCFIVINVGVASAPALTRRPGCA